MSRRWVAPTFVLAALAASLLGVAPASAAVGDLAYQECVAAGPSTTPCAEKTPLRALLGAGPIAISPGGGSVYVAAAMGSLTHLVRDPEGGLDFDVCFNRNAVTGCVEQPALRLNGSSAMELSPDGASLYVGAGEANALTHFAVGAAGRPAFESCVAIAPNPCAPVASINGLMGLAVSPNGKSVYAASFDSQSLTGFLRQPGGSLAFDGCIAGTAGCEPLPGQPLRTATGLALSPDGRTAYITTFEGRLAAIGRDGPGTAFQYLGCFADQGVPTSCDDTVPAEALGQAEDVAVSPDGTSVYVVARDGDAILHFARAPSGSLAFRECISTDAAPGCTDLPGTALDFPSALAISPDGASVYVVGSAADAVSHFARSADGTLSFRGCLAEAGAATGCSGVPAEVMNEPVDLTVSTDGSSVYVTAGESGAVVAFRRSLGDPPPAGGDTPPNGDGGGATCDGKPATIVGTPRRDTLRGTPRRDVIAGLGGNDTIRGRGGNDLICGDGGKDKILGGGGKDRILGGAGKDTISGGGGRDRCTGGPGRDKEACEPVPRRRGAG